MEESNNSQPTITLGGGCFWCMEAFYQRIPGITSITSGYADGDTPDPTYEQICTGTTGHAEVIQLTFTPSKITLRDIFDFFWKLHDPTTLNRQGNDTGTQYRSIILFTSETEKQIAETSKNEAQPQFSAPIVTEIKKLKTFYPAEPYHQNYYNQNPEQPYCRFTIQPKITKLNTFLNPPAR